MDLVHRMASLFIA